MSIVQPPHIGLQHLLLLSLQQAPVSGDLHLQVLLDAEELLVVVLGALHVQPELREIVLQLVQGELQQLHLRGVFMARLSQVTVQCPDLRRERSHRERADLPYLTPSRAFHGHISFESVCQ